MSQFRNAAWLQPAWVTRTSFSLYRMLTGSFMFGSCAQCRAASALITATVPPATSVATASACRGLRRTPATHSTAHALRVSPVLYAVCFASATNPRFLCGQLLKHSCMAAIIGMFSA